jgi:phosphocarrier protein HPr
MPQGTPTEIIKEVMIVNKRGLHARASARFVACVEQFKETSVIVTKDTYAVTGDSIMGLMMLGASWGTNITIKTTSTHGNQAQEAMNALVDLLDNKFGEIE